MATAAEKRERDRVMAHVADGLIEAEKEELAARKAEADRQAAAVVYDKQLFDDYLEARAVYKAKQAELVKLLSQIAEFVGEVAEARIAQEEAVRAAQKAGLGDGLPPKILDLEMRAAREGYTGAYGVPDKSRHVSFEATQALAALNRIRKARV